MQTQKKTSKGFGLVEIVVTAAVLGTTFIVLFGSIQHSVRVAQLSLEQVQAAFLLEEGAEAIRSIRDESWTTLSDASIGTSYYLSWSGTAWTLTTTPNIIDRYTRTIVFSTVERDGNFDITESGSVDDGTLKVSVTVTWESQSGAKTETVDFYITNLFS